jgi:hypothetical protein
VSPFNKPKITEPVFTPATPQEDDNMTQVNDDLTGLPPASEVPEIPETPGSNGTQKRRGRPKLGELPELKLSDLLADEDVPEAEWAAMPTAASPAERSDIQLKIDEDVRKVHASWVEAGKPAVKTSPRKRYVVKPELDATTRGMLTRAGAFTKLRPVIILKSHNQDGTVSIVFTVHDRKVSEKKK